MTARTELLCQAAPRVPRWLTPRRLVRAGEPRLVRARRDPELFADFYAEYYEQVLQFFARRTLDPETAFDLMAETFAAAFADLGAFRGSTEEESRAWMWAIARHKLYRWRERGKVERESLQRLGIEVATMGAIEYERVEELADLSGRRSELLSLLDELPTDQREAVRSRVIDELSYRELAIAMGETEQVVRARVSRGLRRLASRLDQDALDQITPKVLP